MPARYFGEGFVRRLKIPEYVKAPGGIPIRARNLEQQFLMDALLDDSIHMLTCFGKAGTGKTLLSTACALHQTHDETSLSTCQSYSSTTSPAAIWKARTTPWALTATTATARKVRNRLSSACCATKRARRSLRKCSAAIRKTRRLLERRCARQASALAASG